MKKMMMTALLAVSCGLSVFAADNMLKGKWGHWMAKDARAAGSKISIKNDTLNVSVKEKGKKSSYKIQLIKGLTLEKGKKYKFTFDLKTTKAGPISVSYILSKSPYNSYCTKKIKVSPDKTSYECVITPKESAGKYGEPRSLRFFLGNMPESEITISNMVVTEVK